MPRFFGIVAGYAVLAYILILASIHLYEPTRYFVLPNALWFTHLMLLYIHEAGHLIFSVFGRTMNILGGSLNQVLAPLLWFVVAQREGSRLSDVGLFFTGISIMDVSIYVKDAGMLVLPLIGGLSKAHHDWVNLLRQWDMLDDSYPLGEFLFWCGLVIAVGALANGIWKAYHDYKTDPVSTPT